MTIFAVDAAGGLIVSGKYVLGHGATVAKDVQSIQTMTAAIEAIEKSPETLTPEIKAAIQKAAKEMEALGADATRLGKITTALSYAPATGAGVERVMADLVESPMTRKFLSADELKKFGVTDVAKLDEYIGTREQIAKLIKDGGDNTLKLEQEFLKHRAAPAEVLKALKSTKVDGVTKDLAQLVTDLEAKIAKDVASIEPLGKGLKSAQLALEVEKANGTAGDALKPFSEAVTKAETDLKAAVKSSEHRFGSVLDDITKTDKDLGEFLKKEKSISSEVQSVLKNAGAAAAKTSMGWTNKNAAKVEGIAGALWKNRGWGGRATIVAGAGAILYGIVSAVGGRGPGKHADDVARSREQGQAQGVGA